jgi:hypothetical protein
MPIIIASPTDVGYVGCVSGIVTVPEGINQPEDC